MENSKNHKIINIIINTVVTIITLLAVVLLFISLSSKGTGYTNVFGKAYVGVLSDSMEGDNEDSFKKGALIIVDILSDKEKNEELEVGDIVSFYETLPGKKEVFINTHRIVEIQRSAGKIVSVITRGDNPNIEENDPAVLFDDIIGRYEGQKSTSLGEAVVWINTPTGTLWVLVIPSLLMVAYCGFVVFVNAKKYFAYKNTEAIEEGRDKIKTDLEKELREKILKELEEEKNKLE